MDIYLAVIVVIVLLLALYLAFPASGGCGLEYLNGYWELPQIFMEQAKIKSGSVYMKYAAQNIKLYLLLVLDNEGQDVVQNIYDLRLSKIKAQKGGKVITAKAHVGSSVDLAGENDVLPEAGEIEIDIYKGLFRFFGPASLPDGDNVNTGGASSTGGQVNSLYLVAFKNNEVSCGFE